MEIIKKEINRNSRVKKNNDYRKCILERASSRFEQAEDRIK
jgi:hypothetical protein